MSAPVAADAVPSEAALERQPIYAFLAERCAGKRVLDLSVEVPGATDPLVLGGVESLVLAAPARGARSDRAGADRSDGSDTLDEMPEPSPPEPMAPEGGGRPAGVPERVVMDLGAALPFEDAAFDVVVVLDRLADLVSSARERLLREARRVLAPGGVVVAGLADPRSGALHRRAPAEAVRGDAGSLPGAPELRRWVSAEFPYVTLAAQAPFLGWSIADQPDEPRGEEEPDLELSDDAMGDAPEPPTYHLAIAADEPVAVGRSLLVQVPYQASTSRFRAERAAGEQALSEARAEERRRAEDAELLAASLADARQEIERWDRAAQSLAAERDALIAEIRSLKVRHAEELRGQEESHSIEVRQIVEELSAERAALQADHAQLMGELPRLAEAGADALRLRDQMQHMDASAQRMLARNAELEAALAAREQALRAEQRQALDAVRAEHARATELLEEEQRRTVDTIRRERRQEMEALEAEQRKQLSEAQGQVRDKRAQVEVLQEQVVEIEAVARNLQRELDAGTAARERVLAQYEEMLQEHDVFEAERARLQHRVAELEREVDRGRDRVLAADARLRESEERAGRVEDDRFARDRAQAERDTAAERARESERRAAEAEERATRTAVSLGERERALAERAEAAEKLRVQALVASESAAKLRAELAAAQEAADMLRAEIAPANEAVEKLRAELAASKEVARKPAPAADDWSARAQATASRVLQELAGKVEAAEAGRKVLEDELARLRQVADDARREAATQRGQNQALEEEVARLARELRAERVAAEARRKA